MIYIPRKRRKIETLDALDFGAMLSLATFVASLLFVCAVIAS